MLVNILNGLIDTLELIVGAVLGLLPDTPFNFSTLSWGAFGDLVGLVIPVGEVFAHMAVIVSCILLYYAIRWLLRIIKQVQ